jgi:hypothetical protein
MLQRGDRQAARIDRDTLHGGTCRPERVPGKRIAGLFHGHDLARVQGRLRRKEQRHLAAARHEQPRRIRHHAPVRGQIGGKRVAQDGRAPGIAIIRAAAKGRRQDRTAECARQRLVRPQPGIGRTIAERQRRAERHRLCRNGDGNRFRHSFRKILRDEGAARRLGLEPALRRQFLIGRIDRVAVNAEFSRQRARSRQSGARFQAAPHDVASDRLGNRQEQRAARVFLDIQRQRVEDHCIRPIQISKTGSFT